MIISATTGNGFKGALSYINKLNETELSEEQKPKILQENMVFGTVYEQAFMMRDIAKGNARSSRPVLHLSVSFHQEERLSETVRDLIFDKILEEVGATRDNNQFVIAQHFDADHEHYHILLNKVGFDRKNINTSYIKNKCQVIADKIEIDLDLRKTTGRTVVYDAASEQGYRYTTKEERHPKKVFLDKADNVRNVKTELREIISQSMNSTKSVEALLEVLEEKGVDCKANFDAKNQLKGISFRYENQAYKGTQLGLKSKEIQQYYNELDISKGKEIKVSDTVTNKENNQEKKIIVEPKVDLEKIAEDKFQRERQNCYNEISDLELFKDQYSKATNQIITEIKNGEKDQTSLLNLFLEQGFDLKDDKMVFKNYSFKAEIPKEWIEKSVASFFRQKDNFRKEVNVYNDLMNEPLQKIEFFSFPETKKKIREENSVLEAKKENAEEPKFEIWGLEQEEKIIDNIQRNIALTNSKIAALEVEEKNRKKLVQSRLPLSESQIDLYIINRKKYSKVEEYKYDFIEKQRQEFQFKDLFWFDKILSTLENAEKRVEYLQNQFPEVDLDFKYLAEHFFDMESEIVSQKVKLLDSLPNKMIAKRDVDIMNKNNFGNFNGIKALFLKKLSHNTNISLEQKLDSKPDLFTFYFERVKETSKELGITSEDYKQYFLTDNSFIKKSESDCFNAVNNAFKISFKVENEEPKKSKGFRR